MSTLKRSLAASSFWSVSAVIVNQLFTFVVMAVVARILLPKDFGIVAFASVFIELTRSVMLGGLPEALVREKIWSDSRASTAFWANVGLSLVVGTLTALCAVILTATSTRGLLGPVLLALAPCFLLDGLSAAHEAKMRHEFQFKALARRSIIANLGGGIVSLALALAGAGVWALVAQRIVTSILQAAILWASSHWRPKPVFEWPVLRAMLAFSVPMMGSRLLGQLNLRGVEFVLGLLGGPVALGVYRLAYRGLNLLIQSTITPVQSASLSAFSKLKNEEDVCRAYLRVTKMTALLSFPVFFGAAAIAKDFVALAFGPQWTEAGPAMQFLAWMVAPATLTYFLNPAMAAVGRSKLIFGQSMAKAISYVGVACLTAPHGAVAVALGQACVAYAGLPFAMLTLKKGIGVKLRDSLDSIWAPAVAAGLMSLSVIALQKFALSEAHSIVRLVISVGAGLPLYLLALRLIGWRHVQFVWNDVGQLLPGPGRRLLQRWIGQAS